MKISEGSTPSHGRAFAMRSVGDIYMVSQPSNWSSFEESEALKSLRSSTNERMTSRGAHEIDCISATFV